MDGPDIPATGRNVKTQVAGEGLCVVGSVAERRVSACRDVSRECGRGRSGGRARSFVGVSWSAGGAYASWAWSVAESTCVVGSVVECG